MARQLLILALIFAPTLRRMAERVLHLEAGLRLLMRRSLPMRRSLSARPRLPCRSRPTRSPPARQIARGGGLAVWVRSPDEARGDSVRSALDRSLDYIVDTLDKVERRVTGIASRDLGRQVDLAAAVAHLRRRDVLGSRIFLLGESLRLIRAAPPEAGRARFDRRRRPTGANLRPTPTRRVEERARMPGVLADASGG